MTYPHLLSQFSPPLRNVWGNGDWALGIGHWGLGIGDWALGIGDKKNKYSCKIIYTFTIELYELFPVKSSLLRVPC